MVADMIGRRKRQRRRSCPLQASVAVAVCARVGMGTRLIWGGGVDDDGGNMCNPSAAGGCEVKRNRRSSGTDPTQPSPLVLTHGPCADIDTRLM